ncbi:uncharacterized protein MYCFIDRAFT_82392 [Pseudocercospora fijiensis CIRAD86]|uniref:Uncharacterized protein n=1 Tax=Pseudocercospora fijiensis (strain CIRAD86) TaxID=383855 RepID=M3AZ69_PSEFD|nr:uncharacterized protein MYCFIDRAFT_82392 [Pseudocercospora fijiensis CIRAD86]EME82483.1 hypothetical protein MYCFIDRAFT_82392 [Pseudocercospora fijiensis CIRAD86]
MANSSIDYILLNNFPAAAKDWCHAEKGLKKSRLQRVQEILRRGLYAVALAMRWPGRRWYNLHLGQCVLYPVVGFVAFEVAMVACLAALQIFLWSGNEMACMTGWDPLPAERRRKAWLIKTRVAPSTGRKPLSLVNSEPFFVEGDDATGESVAATAYHTVTAQPGVQNLSLEELRLQHYRDVGLAPSTPPPMHSPLQTPQSHSAAIHSHQEDSFMQSEESDSSTFPKWISERFNDSIFDPFISSSRRDSFGLRDQSLVASSDTEDAGQKTNSSVPDLLTGSPVVGRKFI